MWRTFRHSRSLLRASWAAVAVLSRSSSQPLTAPEAEAEGQDGGAKRNLFQKNETKRMRVVIVGAGVAGRSCLTELEKCGEVDEEDILVVDSNPSAISQVMLNSRVKTTNCGVSCLNIDEKSIELTSGEKYNFEKCLLSIGKEAAQVESRYVMSGCSADSFVKIDSNTTGQELERLKSCVRNHKHVTLLGGSWLSIALSSYLAKFQAGKRLVTVVIPSSSPLNKILPKYLSVALTRYLQGEGIDVLPYSKVRFFGTKETLQFPFLLPEQFGDVTVDDDFVVVHVCCAYDSLQTSMFPTDAVVLCAESSFPGCNQNDTIQCNDNKFETRRTWLYESGLEIDEFGCISVNRSLQAVEGIYVAGDLASYPQSNVLVKGDVETNQFWRGYDVGLRNAARTGHMAARIMSAKQCTSSSISPPVYHARTSSGEIDLVFFGDCLNEYASYSFWQERPDNCPDQTTRFNKSSSNDYLNKQGVIFYVNNENKVKGMVLSHKGDSDSLAIEKLASQLIGLDIKEDTGSKNITAIETRQYLLKRAKLVLLGNCVNKSDECSTETVEPKIRIIYSRPHSGIATGRTSAVNFRDQNCRLPWRYNIHSSIQSENIFYSRSR